VIRLGLRNPRKKERKKDCPHLKGVDKRTQERITNWIQKLHEFLAHLHALDIEEAQAPKYPGVEQLRGIKTTQLVDKYIVKRNRIRNQCALLKNIGEEGTLLATLPRQTRRDHKGM